MSKDGEVLWFTGLSGSGKSTTARALVEPLRVSGRKVELLDGDELRRTISQGLGFSREDRIKNVERIVFLCKLLSRNGVTVIVSAITPYEEMRAHARAELPGYVEIFVDCPLKSVSAEMSKGYMPRPEMMRLSNLQVLATRMKCQNSRTLLFVRMWTR